MVVHTRCGDLSERVGVYLRELAVHFDALGEESKHIVPDGFHWLSGVHLTLALYVLQELAYMFQTSLRLSRRHMHWELTAAEAIALRGGRSQDKAAVDIQFPALLHG